MSLIISSPTVYIDNKKIQYSSLSYSKDSIHALSKLAIKSSDMNLKLLDLIKKEVKFYLNHGSTDNVPFFRGYVNSITPTSNGLTIQVLDCMQFLTGEQTQAVKADKNNNFDGMTLGQFLYNYVTKYVNINDKVYIGLDMLNDTNPSKSLTGYRTKDPKTPLEILKKHPVIDNSMVWDNDNSDSTSLPWFLDVEDDGTKSNIMFKKLQSRTKDKIRQAVPFSLDSGLVSYSYKKHQAINTVAISGKENGSETYLRTHDYRTAISATRYSKDVDYPDEARNEAHLIINNSRNNDIELNITVNKGFYLPVGSLIQIKQRSAPIIDGYHNIVGKKINISNNSIKCQLSLNKPKPVLSDYLEPISNLYH